MKESCTIKCRSYVYTYSTEGGGEVYYVNRHTDKQTDSTVECLLLTLYTENMYVLVHCL